MSANLTTNIRTMQLSDIPRVFEIECDAHVDPWTEGILKDCLRIGYQCLVLELNKKTQGFSIAQIAVGECHLLNICIEPKLQHHGLGKFLLQHIIQKMQQQKVNIIYLEVRASNIKAQKLYEKFEFKQIGQRKAYYPTENGREDAIILALQLT